MQPALACSPSERGLCFLRPASGHAQWKRDVTARCLLGESRGVAVSLHQGPRKVPAVLREPPTAQGPPTVVHGQTAVAGEWREDLHEGMTGLVARQSTPGSQAKASGAAMAGGAGSRDWQMPCLEPPLPERRSTRRAAKRWGSPEMPMLLPAIGKVGPAAAAAAEEEEEAVVALQKQLLLERFQGSVEVDSIEGVDFFSFSSAEDLREFARSMDQLMSEQYREPRSPEGSAPSARSGAAEDEWRESDWTEEQQSVVVLPRKTTDITKIKGWRRKAFTSDHVGDHAVADQAADQTTRWVMDQMNEQAWRHQEEQEGKPAPAEVGSSAPGKRVAQPPAAPVASLSKSVRGAFLSSSLDEFLEHRAELRVGQLAQLNPNIVPPPQGQGVLALSTPPVAAPPGPAQVGPTREMTSHAPRRYGRAAESPIATRSTRSEKPDRPSGQRRSSAVANQAAEEELAASSSPKLAPKRAKVEDQEEAPFLAMTSRKLRGSSGQGTLPDSAAAPPPAPPPPPPKEAPRKEPEPKPSSAAAAPKKAAQKEALPPYGASAGSEDYPLVTETVLSGKQRELLRALLVSTQCSRPLTVALPAEPCFVCPQLDQGDALAAASALGLPGKDKGPPPQRRESARLSGAARREEAAAAAPAPSTAQKAESAAKATAGPSVSTEVAKQAPPVAKQSAPPVSTREPAAKGSPAETAAKTPRKSRAWPLPGGTLTSPPEAPQSTRSRRPIRLPARFQDSALYFSPNGDLFDVVPPVSPRQRTRVQPTPSPKVATAAPRPPVHVPPPAEDPPSTTTSSWSVSSSSSSSSSPSSSRSSSPCESCQPSKASQGKKQAPHLNGGQTLKQLSRLKTDGFVSLHKLESRRPPSTSPEGSVDIDVESISDSDSGNHWRRAHPSKEKLDDKACRERQRRHEMFQLFLQLQNVVFRTPSTRPLSKISILGQASQFLRCQKVLSAHYGEEKRWELQRRAALQACLEAARLGHPVQLPKMEPRPPPLPSYVGKVVDLSSPTVPPLREPVEEPPTPRVPTPPPPLPPSKLRFRTAAGVTTHGFPVGGSKRLIASDKEKHPAKSGGAEQPPVGLKDAAAPRAPGEPVPGTTFKLGDGHIGALRSVPAAAADVPRKYTLYPVKGTVLGDLSKVAAAAQHIIGPCVIKRVKLRSGQTVFVYRQPTAGGGQSEEGKAPQLQQVELKPPPDQEGEGSQQGSPASPQGSAASQEGLPASQQGSSASQRSSFASQQGSSASQQGSLASLQSSLASLQGSLASLQGSPTSPQGSPASPQGSPASPQGSPASPQGSPASLQGSPASLQDDAGLGETSEWVSGDGDTCIVMKLPVSSDEDSDSSSESSES